jgi:hypothetical protein
MTFFLEPSAVALSGTTTFVEWTMGLTIKGIEVVYPDTTRMRIGATGRNVERRDCFDFVGPTVAPVPVVGGFVRWFTRGSSPEGSGRERSGHQQHNFISECVCCSPHPALHLQDLGSQRG